MEQTAGANKEMKSLHTWDAQAVSHPNTNQAGPCLASRSDKIGRVQGGLAESNSIGGQVRPNRANDSSKFGNEKLTAPWYSQAVSHPSTNQSGPCLASRSDENGRVIGVVAVSNISSGQVGPNRANVGSIFGNEKLTAPGIPRQSPIQALTRPEHA